MYKCVLCRVFNFVVVGVLFYVCYVVWSLLFGSLCHLRRVVAAVAVVVVPAMQQIKVNVSLLLWLPHCVSSACGSWVLGLCLYMYLYLYLYLYLTDIQSSSPSKRSSNVFYCTQESRYFLISDFSLQRFLSQFLWVGIFFFFFLLSALFAHLPLARTRCCCYCCCSLRLGLWLQLQLHRHDNRRHRLRRRRRRQLKVAFLEADAVIQ